MGRCFSAPKKDHSRNVTLAIFGLDNAGKSSVVKVLQGGSQSEVVPTVGFATNQLKWKKTAVTVLDVGGGARIRDIWKNYFAESYGLVFVVDASDRDRIVEAGEVFSKLLSDQRIQGKPVLLLLNKQDASGAINETQATEQMQLEPLVNNNKCPCRVEAISATRGTGKQMDAALNEGFDWLIRHIIDHYQELTNKVNRDTEVQRAQLAKEKEERMERIRKAREEREARGEEDDDEELREKTNVDGPDAHQKQNGHAKYSQEASDAISQTSRSISNGHLPPLADFGNRQKRRVRPSSSGEESATLTTSYQASVIPHLPPIISPPDLRRPLPKLPTSDEIPPPSTPPPADAAAMTETPLTPKPLPLLSPSFPKPPSFSDIGIMADQNGQSRSEDTVEISEQAARRKRRKKRLQRFNNQTVPVNDHNGGDSISIASATPGPSILRTPLGRNSRLPSLDPPVSNGSSMSVSGVETDKPSKSPRPLD